MLIMGTVDGDVKCTPCTGAAQCRLFSPLQTPLLLCS